MNDIDRTMIKVIFIDLHRKVTPIFEKGQRGLKSKRGPRSFNPLLLLAP